MSVIYITEDGCEVCVNSNRIVVKNKSGECRNIPLETVEGITIIGKSQMTTGAIQVCLTNGIPIAFLSKGGKYFGRLVSTGHARPGIQRLQAKYYNSEFAMNLAKNLIHAKVRNQLVLMRRYARNKSVEIADCEKGVLLNLQKVTVTASFSKLMGYEGQCARYYFEGL